MIRDKYSMVSDYATKASTQVSKTSISLLDLAVPSTRGLLRELLTDLAQSQSTVVLTKSIRHVVQVLQAWAVMAISFIHAAGLPQTKPQDLGMASTTSGLTGRTRENGLHSKDLRDSSPLPMEQALLCIQRASMKDNGVKVWMADLQTALRSTRNREKDLVSTVARPFTKSRTVRIIQMVFLWVMSPSSRCQAMGKDDTIRERCEVVIGPKKYIPHASRRPTVSLTHTSALTVTI